MLCGYIRSLLPPASCLAGHQTKFLHSGVQRRRLHVCAFVHFFQLLFSLFVILFVCFLLLLHFVLYLGTKTSHGELYHCVNINIRSIIVIYSFVKTKNGKNRGEREREKWGESRKQHLTPVFCYGLTSQSLLHVQVYVRVHAFLLIVRIHTYVCVWSMCPLSIIMIFSF